MSTEEYVKQEEGDILPDLTQLNEDLKLFEPETERPVMKAASEPTSHGCIGLGKGLEVCVDVYDGKLDFYIHILGQRVAGRTIDSHGTTQDYSANIGFAKVSGSYRVDWSKKSCSVKGKACYWKVVKWACVSYSKTILSW